MENVKAPEESRQLPVVIHQAEHAVSLPANLPATDPNVPRVALTQEQVDFLVNNTPGSWLPTLKKWWPIILMVLGLAGKVGGMVEKSLSTIPDPPAAVATLPKSVAETPKAPDLQQMLELAVKRAIEKTAAKVEPKSSHIEATPTEVRPEPVKELKFKD